MADVFTNTSTQCNRVKLQLYMLRRLTGLADSFSTADRQYIWHDAQMKCLLMNSRKKEKKKDKSVLERREVYISFPFANVVLWL